VDGYLPNVSAVAGRVAGMGMIRCLRILELRDFKILKLFFYISNSNISKSDADVGRLTNIIF
jgi:hypothetical protein